MTYGRRCPKGSLPIFSVETEEEAEALISRCCEQVWIGPEHTELAWLAQELETEQTLENLYAFGKRLAAEYARMKGASHVPN